jgi:cytochrome P450
VNRLDVRICQCESVVARRAVIEDMVAVTMELIEARRQDPRDDLISKWVHTDGWDAGRVFEEVILVLDGGAVSSTVRALASPFPPGRR